MAEFQIGDCVTVTGDTQNTNHQIDSGSEAVVLLSAGNENEYFVSVQHTPDEARTLNWGFIGWEDLWIPCEIEWVGAEDLDRRYPTIDEYFNQWEGIQDGSETQTNPATNPRVYFEGQDVTEHLDVDSLTFTPTPGFVKADDAVRSPNHYSQGLPEGLEVKDIIKAQGFWRDFCAGNVIKYSLRWQHKNGVEDLRKMVQYGQWLIDELEKDDDDS